MNKTQVVAVRSNKSIITACCALFLACLCIGSAVAQTETNKVHWILYDFPPYLTSEPNYSREEPVGEGAAIEFLKYVTEHMTDFQHEFEVANISRVIGAMKNGIFACNPLLLKVPERESFVEFSSPIIMALPHHIVVAEENFNKLKPYLNSQGSVNFAQLVTSPNLTTSITSKRAYPPVVTEALKNPSCKHHRILRSPDFNTPIKQLLVGRIDYVVVYPFEIHWYADKIEKNNELSLKYVPIAGIPEFALARVGCTKGERGKKIIQRINQLILEAGPRPPWNEFQLRYLEPNARQRLEELLEQYKPLHSLTE